MINRDSINKILAAILLGGLMGWNIHHDEMTWGVRGREAFIAYQMHRFDMYMANPRPVVYSVIVTALLGVGFCLIYEFIASCLSAAIKGPVSGKSAD
jgi:hypothetical protein